MCQISRGCSVLEKKSEGELKRKLAEDFPARYTVLLPEVRDWIAELQLPVDEEKQLMSEIAQLTNEEAIELIENILNETI